MQSIAEVMQEVNNTAIDRTGHTANTSQATNAMKKLTYNGMKKQKHVHFYEPDSQFLNEAKGAKFGKLRIVVAGNNELQFRLIGKEKVTDQFTELKTTPAKSPARSRAGSSSKKPIEEVKQHDQSEKAKQAGQKEKKAQAPKKKETAFGKKDIVGFTAQEICSNLSSELNISNELCPAKKYFGKFDFIEEQESIQEILHGFCFEDRQNSNVEVNMVQAMQEPAMQTSGQNVSQQHGEQMPVQKIQQTEEPANWIEFPSDGQNEDDLDSMDYAEDCGAEDEMPSINHCSLRPMAGVNSLPEENDQRIQDFKYKKFEGTSVQVHLNNAFALPTTAKQPKSTTKHSVFASHNIKL